MSSKVWKDPELQIALARIFGNWNHLAHISLYFYPENEGSRILRNESVYLQE
jgi:hypothetical protein